MAQSVKIPDEFMAIVRPEAERQSRSVAGQITHWARIGRAIERSGAFSYERIDAALNGYLSPEDLSDEEGAVWMDAFVRKIGSPSEDEKAFFENRKTIGRGVGLNEQGELVYAAKNKT